MKVSMQQKLIFLLASAFGFTALAAHVFLPAYISYQATLLRQKPPSTDRSIPSLPGKLALNATQKESIVQINRAFNHKIHEILTTEQLQQFTAAFNSGLTLLTALNNLSLTDEQKNQLRMALRSAQSQVEKLLTPEQLEYIRQQYENRYNNQQPNYFKSKLENKKYYVILYSFSHTTV